MWESDKCYLVMIATYDCQDSPFYYDHGFLEQDFRKGTRSVTSLCSIMSKSGASAGKTWQQRATQQLANGSIWRHLRSPWRLSLAIRREPVGGHTHTWPFPKWPGFLMRLTASGILGLLILQLRAPKTGISRELGGSYMVFSDSTSEVMQQIQGINL